MKKSILLFGLVLLLNVSNILADSGVVVGLDSGVVVGLDSGVVIGFIQAFAAASGVVIG